MSLFVSKENQNMLWTAINKVPRFQLIPPQQRDVWFRSYIEAVYNKYKNTTLNANSLKELNKNTISMMMETLKQYGTEPQYPSQQSQYTPQPQSPYSHNMNQMQQPQNQYFTHEHEQQARMMQMADLYGQRKQEFDNLYSRPTPPDIDFRIQTNERPIQNAEELVDHYKRQREVTVNNAQTIPTNIFPDIVPPTQGNIFNPLQQPQTNMASILEEIVQLKSIIMSLTDKINTITNPPPMQTNAEPTVIPKEDTISISKVDEQEEKHVTFQIEETPDNGNNVDIPGDDVKSNQSDNIEESIAE